MSIRAKIIRYLPHVIGIFIIAVLTVFSIKFLETEEAAPERKKVIQQVTVIAPPPPPPPPPPEQEPEVHEPEEAEPIDDMDEAMPDEDMGEDVGNDLGIDADGSAGGDSFGLRARKGGRGIVGGGYGALVVQEINALLVDEDRLRRQEYTVILNLWISENGDIERYKIDTRSGDAIVEEMIASAILRLGTISQGPPLELPQPIRLRIKSRI